MGSCGAGVLRQHHTPGIPPGTGWHSVLDFECSGAVSSPPLRIQQCSTSSRVCSGALECLAGFAQSPFSGPRLRVDLVSGGLPRTSLPVACHNRPLCDVSESLPACVLRSGDGSAVGWHGCHAPVMGRPAGLCPPSLQPHLVGSGEGSSILGVGADPGGSIMASAPLVSRSSGASGGDSLLPATKEGSSQTTAFPSLPPEPPRASADCVLYLQRSTQHSGVSAAVARQLAHCRSGATVMAILCLALRYLRWLTSCFIFGVCFLFLIPLSPPAAPC